MKFIHKIVKEYHDAFTVQLNGVWLLYLVN
jgi:hypothetical protein